MIISHRQNNENAEQGDVHPSVSVPCPWLFPEIKNNFTPTTLAGLPSDLNWEMCGYV